MKKVLLVDDEPEIKDIIIEVLNAVFPEKLEISTSADGLDAIRKIGNVVYDVVITDLKMPKADGKKLLREIENMAADKRPKYVMVLSAFNTEEHIRYEEYSTSYVMKPFRNDVLVDYLKNTIFGVPVESLPMSHRILSRMSSVLISTIETATGVRFTEAGVEEGDADREDLYALTFAPILSKDLKTSISIELNKKTYLWLTTKLLKDGKDALPAAVERREAISSIFRSFLVAGVKAIHEEKSLPALKELALGRVQCVLGGKCVRFELGPDSAHRVILVFEEHEMRLRASV